MENIDIIQTTSADIPYEKIVITSANIQLPSLLVGTTNIIECTKVYTKKFKSMTYFKLEFPCELKVSSEKELTFGITRPDNHCMCIITKITNNIIEFETEQIEWRKMPNPSVDDYNKVIEELGRIRPYRQDQIGHQPAIWIDSTGSRTADGIYLRNPGTTSDGITNITYTNATSINTEDVLREYASDINKIFEGKN